MADILFTISEIIFLISYLCKDILNLRLVTLIALTGYVIAGFVVGFFSPGMMALISFTFLGIAINLYEVYQIIIDRKPLLLPDNLKDLYASTFKTMTPREFFNVFNYATIVKHQKGDTLTSQGDNVPNLMMIKTGEVEIIKNGKVVINLGSGYFIGEMSYLSDSTATATVKTLSDSMELISWQRDALKKLESKNDELYTKFKQAIAVNLVKKLDRQIS